jgi:hypothetical protein
MTPNVQQDPMPQAWWCRLPSAPWLLEHLNLLIAAGLTDFEVHDILVALEIEGQGNAATIAAIGLGGAVDFLGISFLGLSLATKSSNHPNRQASWQG